MHGFRGFSMTSLTFAFSLIFYSPRMESALLGSTLFSLSSSTSDAKIRAARRLKIAFRATSKSRKPPKFNIASKSMKPHWWSDRKFCVTQKNEVISENRLTASFGRIFNIFRKKLIWVRAHGNLNRIYKADAEKLQAKWWYLRLLSKVV